MLGLVGTQSERFRKATLIAEDIGRLTIIDARCSSTVGGFSASGGIYDSTSHRRSLTIVSSTLWIIIYFYFAGNQRAVDDTPLCLNFAANKACQTDDAFV